MISSGMSTIRTILLLPLLAAVACSADDASDDGTLPEPTTFTVSVEHLGLDYPYFASGRFDTPVGAPGLGPLLPGQRYAFEFYAPPGARLSFASMFAPSNDLFFAPAPEGIALFDDGGQPRAGDLTGELALWDAGTELDEPLGLGEHQVTTQAEPNSGDADPNPSVRPATDSYANLPDVSALVRVTLESDAGNHFIVTLENISTEQSLILDDDTTSPVLLSPGTFVVHGEGEPLFSVGEATRADGLEAQVEDGDPGPLVAALAPQTGIVSPLAPGVWWVHGEGEPLFRPGQPDLGQGLEGVAEDGDPAALLSSYPADANIGTFGGVYGEDVTPLGPGQAFVFDIEARPGERLTFASMFAQSNDVFLAFGPDGVALFDDAGAPIGGDLSAQIQLWDLGTEINEYPGVGPNQAPRQAGPNTGPDEGGSVRLVDDGWVYPSPASIVRLTIAAQ